MSSSIILGLKSCVCCSACNRYSGQQFKRNMNFLLISILSPKHSKPRSGERAVGERTRMRLAHPTRVCRPPATFCSFPPASSPPHRNPEETTRHKNTGSLDIPRLSVRPGSSCPPDEQKDKQDLQPRSPRKLLSPAEAPHSLPEVAGWVVSDITIISHP